jgi:radical SAM family uncharacterized protein
MTFKLHDFNIISNELLRLEKPGRYVGGEYNQVVKDWSSVQTHVALVFPDIYELGVPNLGLAILYDILNRQPDILAERAYSPWSDMEALLRRKDFPPYSLESKTPLDEFDIIGFTLPYESIYTNALNILDLAKIPLHSSDRTIHHPLVIAGGQAAFNPEPMADFIDAFVLGEGEEVILEIVHAFQLWKNAALPKPDLLLKLSSIPGVYVPSFYNVSYYPDGTVEKVTPNTSGIPTRVEKRLLAKLPHPVTKFLVPNIEVVHDRVSIEIMRGCTRGCRFCHAGMVNRPIRERSVDDILDAIDESLAATGYEQISLLSLSSSDHKHVVELVDSVHKRFKVKRLAVTLPSLRIASFSVELMDKLKDLRPGGGFTIAPEAATERLRNIINKPLSDDELFETVRAVFKHGWLSLKLYFMIGLPGETLEDVNAIVTTCRRINAEARSIVGGRARINVGISAFIPKPHTPFQWVPADDPDTLHQKINLLRDGFHKTSIKLTTNRSDSTQLETWLSRGDRRLGQVIFNAWQNGAKFDAWGDQLNIQAWKDAFRQADLDPLFYSQRERQLDEILPWDHISVGLRKEFLKQDYAWSKQGKTRADCREQCYYCGILSSFENLRAITPGAEWSCP